ncbi:hypothetical protein TB2_034079 [Malus domestica]
MEFKIRSLGFNQSFVVPSNGRSGELSLLWSNEVELEVKSYSPNHIDSVCKEMGTAQWWRLTGFYGHPATANRNLSWSLLTNLSQHVSLQWL